MNGNNNHIDVDQLKRAAAGRWSDIIVGVGGVDVAILDGRHHPCPRCGGKDRFRAFSDFAETGGVLCNQCHSERNGDGLSSVQWLLNCDFPTAARRVADYLGVTSSGNGKTKTNGKPEPLPFNEQVKWQDSNKPTIELCRTRTFEAWAQVKSGVTVDAIRAAGGRLCTWPRNCDEPYQCIAFPAQRTPTGDVTGWILYRADGRDFPAIPNGPGQRKTHTLGGSKDGWVILGGWDRLKKASVVVKVEGLPDALAVYSRLPDGHVVITNICGCESVNLPLGALKGKRLIVIGDADVPGQHGAKRFCSHALANKIDDVRIAKLQFEIVADHGKDVRDFVVEGGDVEELLAGAVKADPAEPQKVSPQNNVDRAVPAEEDDDPHRLARICLRDMPKLRTYRSEFYLWRNPAYQILPADELKSKVTASTKIEFNRLNLDELESWVPTGKKPEPPKAIKVTKSLVGNVVQALQSITVTPSSLELPTWIDMDPPFPAEECVVTSAGILHLPSLVAGKASLIGPTPFLFTINAVDYRFDPKAICPQWQKFLVELWPDDQSSIDTLQEIIGYLLLPDTSQQKFFMFIGPRRSGKGTIGRVIRQVVGPENIAAPTLGSLQGDFGMQPLLGKTVAIVGDARLSGRTDAAVIVERLLSISGEDAQTVNRKHISQVTAQLKTRFLLISNELPKLYDASATLPSRMILLRMTNSFYGKEDHKLTDRLLTERAGILNWAILGWQRLQERGYFVQPKASEELIETMVDIASPITSFIEDCCEIGGGLQVTVADLFKNWKEWCESKGRKPGTEQSLGRDLSAAAPFVSMRRPSENGKRVRVYEGIRIINSDSSAIF